MKTTVTRKEIQDKLNYFITELVKTVIDSESKKIKKSIKKASKTLAKAIVRKINDSDGQISIGKNMTAEKKVPAPAKKVVRGKKPIDSAAKTAVKRKTVAVKNEVVKQTKDPAKVETA